MACKVWRSNVYKTDESDKFVYIKYFPNHIVTVCLYVDDMLKMSNDIGNINATKYI